MKVIKEHLTYALKDDRLVHINDVENGIVCGCICPNPNCHAPLIAKNEGSIRIHHFAHREGEECGKGFETVVHILAKQILSQNDKIKLPTLFLEGGFKGRPIWKENYVPYSDVKTEYKTGDIIPDVILSVGDEKKSLAVEIYVSHKVDDNKIRKFKQLSLPAIEIDLSKIDPEISKAELEDILINSAEYKKWIYNDYISLFKKHLYKLLNHLKAESHRYALHVMGCPLQMRSFKGMPYANFIDDCACCECLYNVEVNENDEITGILCTANKPLDSDDKIIKAVRTSIVNDKNIHN